MLLFVYHVWRSNIGRDICQIKSDHCSCCRIWTLVSACWYAINIQLIGYILIVFCCSEIIKKTLSFFVWSNISLFHFKWVLNNTYRDFLADLDRYDSLFDEKGQFTCTVQNSIYKCFKKVLFALNYLMVTTYSWCNAIENKKLLKHPSRFKFYLMRWKY